MKEMMPPSTQNVHGTIFEHDHGTTTLAFKYSGGICLCVDSRASRGQFIGSQTVQKVVEITPFLLGTIAGGAADCQYWERVLSVRCRKYELENDSRISAGAASTLLANMVYRYKGKGLSMGTMMIGYDNDEPKIYYVDDGGQRMENNRFCVGSGMMHAYGILDTEYRYELTDEEAEALGRKAIYHATNRDAYSGGCINCYIMKPEGWTRKAKIESYEYVYNEKEFE
eukprot:TRINITY_DN2296_c0_g1_i1.p2 TRINITY_DN2296_c0_g1~~TRINITY_DN2296_c0_g1_i1.p2  ORF type:complete len:226 (-),score=67.14 TRINITY_DN2296_c0_g1_i1:526-1203(-)